MYSYFDIRTYVRRHLIVLVYYKEMFFVLFFFIGSQGPVKTRPLDAAAWREAVLNNSYDRKEERVL